MSLPVIKTTRVLLRSFRNVDIDALSMLWTDPQVRRYLWDNEIISREQATDRLLWFAFSWRRAGPGVALWLLARLVGAWTCHGSGTSSSDICVRGLLVPPCSRRC